MTDHHGLLQFYLLSKVSLTLVLAHENLMTTCMVWHFSQNPSKNVTKDEIFPNIYLMYILHLSKDSALEWTAQVKEGVTLQSPMTGCGTLELWSDKAEVSEKLESMFLGSLSQPQWLWESGISGRTCSIKS